jgi:hypothetical protein
VRDTSAEVDKRVGALLAAMSGSQRALLAAQMFETAQLIVLSSLPARMDEAARKRELCRRFYGEDLARKAFGGVG